MRTLSTMGAALALFALSATTAHAQSPTMGMGEEVQTEPTWVLFGIGGGMLLVEYVGELVATAAMGGSAGELERAAIPLIGSWLELAERSDMRWWEVALTIYEGAMQIVAVGLMVVGLAWQQPVGMPDLAPASASLLPAGSAGGLRFP